MLEINPRERHYHECPCCSVLSECHYADCVREADKRDWTTDGTLVDSCGCCQECNERDRSRVGVHRGETDDGVHIDLPIPLPPGAKR